MRSENVNSAFEAGRRANWLERYDAPKPCGGEVNSGRHYNLAFLLRADTREVSAVSCKACNYIRALSTPRDPGGEAG